MICNVCQTNQARYDQTYGYLPCTECIQRQRDHPKPNSVHEFTTDQIKEDRVKYLELHGSQSINATEQELKNAKNVWGEIDYYDD